MKFRLFDRLPEGVTVGGRFFKCDFDFRNVLKMLDVMQMQELTPAARDYLCVKCVFRGRLPFFFEKTVIFFGISARTHTQPREKTQNNKKFPQPYIHYSRSFFSAKF